MELISFEDCPKAMAVVHGLPKGSMALKAECDLKSTKLCELDGGTLVTVNDGEPASSRAMPSNPIARLTTDSQRLNPFCPQCCLLATAQ